MPSAASAVSHTGPMLATVTRARSASASSSPCATLRATAKRCRTCGELVKTIADTWYPKGEHTVAWNGETQSGGKASSGVYYVRSAVNGSKDVIKAVLTK